ncbi:hypothetical protein [Nocardioides kribbensis]|uniref:ATP-binding protein n=1 Tax=Nocardioides kribbensis TaxID=305517 RepID=A0ABV1NTF8_9ACTN
MREPKTTYRIKQLIRGDKPLERSANAARRLLQVASAWGPSTELEVTLGALGRRGNSVTFRVVGDIPGSWDEDLRWALAGVADIEPTSAREVSAPTYVTEIRAARDLAPVPVTGDHEQPERHDIAAAEFQRMRAVRQITPWPTPMSADLGELLGLNIAEGVARLDLVVRYRISAATQLEEEITGESVHASWDYNRGGVHDYLGTPIRVRALIGSNRGPLPARVEAIVRQWGSFLDLTPLDPFEATTAWSGGPLDLAGHAIPAGTALTVVRIPAAGSQPFPGIRAAEPPVTMMPLDPVPPRPKRPIRLGRARTAEVNWTDVFVDLEDLTQHGFVQGATGSRKTTFMASLAVGIQMAGGSYTWLAESSGVDAVLRRTPAECAGAVRVIRHSDPALNVPLNLLAAKPDKLERMVAAFAEMTQHAQDPNREGMVGPRWVRYFTLTALNAVAHLGVDATLVTVARIAGDINRVRALAKATQASHPELSHALMSEYGRLSDKEASDLTSWGASKFQELLSSEAIRWVLGSGPDPIDVAAAMDSGTSLLVDLGAHELGQTAARAIGATYLLKHWGALGERQRKDRLHVLLVDEAHLFSYGPLPKLLAEARKYGVGVVVSTQHLGQLTGELADALESNTGMFISLRAGLQSAQRASTKLMSWPTADLVRLPNGIAAATISRDGVVTEPFSLHVDFHDRTKRLERQGLVGEHIAEQVIDRSHAELARRYQGISPISDVELARRLQRPKPEPSELDNWLARRARASSGPPAPAVETPQARVTEGVD